MLLLVVALFSTILLLTQALTSDASARDPKTLVFDSVNVFDPHELIQSSGGEVRDVEIHIWETEQINQPLILIGPSSTPNMRSEKRLAKLLHDLGHNVAIIYGYKSRKKGIKFSVTSSSLAADYIFSSAKLIENGFGDNGFVGLGTSNGSLAIFNIILKGVREQFIILDRMKKVITLNSACYENFDAAIFDSEVNLLIISGEKDDSTPASSCVIMADKLLANGNDVTHYIHPDGHHNFFLNYIKNEGFHSKSKYIIPNCSIGLTSNLHQTLTVRENGETQEVTPNNRKSILKECLGQGHINRTSKYGEQTIISLIDKFVRQ